MSYFDEAHERLSRYFRKGQYDLYDGAFVQQNAELSVTDILLSVALNSQLDTRNKIWHVWRKKSTIEEALANVPNTIKLEDEEVPWEKLHVLFDTFCQIKYAKEAVTTKILHKKRPNLIPIYDRYVWSHFKSERPHRKRWGFLIELTAPHSNGLAPLSSWSWYSI